MGLDQEIWSSLLTRSLSCCWLAFGTAAKLTTVWCHRGEDPAGMLAAQAVRDLTLPGGRSACWVGLEAAAMRAVRRHLLGERCLADHPDHDTRGGLTGARLRGVP